MKGNISKTGKFSKAERVLIIRHNIKMGLNLLIDLSFYIL